MADASKEVLRDQNGSLYEPVPELTQLGRYMQDCGISNRWLAAQVYVSPSTVSRWMWGKTTMAPAMRSEVLEVLQHRAAAQTSPPLELLDDQLDPRPLGPVVR